MSFKKHFVRAYTHEFSKVSFVPNSNIIATIGMDKNAIDNHLKLWDYSNPVKVTAVKTNSIATGGSAFSIATNQSKNFFAIAKESDLMEGSSYSLINIYDFKTQKRIKQIKINTNIKESLSEQKVDFSPDGNFLVFSASNLRVWDTEDWKLIATINGNPKVKNKVIPRPSRTKSHFNFETSICLNALCNKG